MRPELPWNVAGIPPEAREAARAAARREGLSVGEWLTRRILRSFADIGDPSGDQPARADWQQSGNAAPASTYPDDYAPSSRRESEAMLARVSRTENDSQDAFRRIEEQLRTLSRRLDATERSQTENNRAMSKAATEINIAAREQTQAFDQLGGHVIGLNERLERVERYAENNGTKEAVKALQQGLSRLAEQISQTAHESTAQIASLAGNVESLAAKFLQARNEADQATHTIDLRLQTLDERVRAAEKAAQVLEKALDALDARQSSNTAIEPELQRQAAAMAQLGDTLDRLNTRLAANEAQSAGAMARVEESIARLESRGAENGLDRRLQGIERVLSNISDRLEKTEKDSSGTATVLNEGITALNQRLEATEKKNSETIADLRGVLDQVMHRTHQPAAAQAGSPAQAQSSHLDLPPFTESSVQSAPPSPADPFAPSPPFHAPPPADPFAPAQEPFDAPANFAEPAQGFAGDPFAGPQGQNAFAQSNTGESYLSAARRAARSAAMQADAERARGPMGAFTWGANRPVDATEKKPKRYGLIAGLAFIAILAAVAGVMLSQRMNTQTSSPESGLGGLFHKPAQNVWTTPSPQSPLPMAAAPAPQTTAPATAPGSPVLPSTANTHPSGEATSPPAPAAAATPGSPSHTRPITPPPPQSAKPAASQTASLSPINRLVAQAQRGDANAQTLLGLKYLDGDGVPQNDGEAAKWFQKAAAQGQAIAQYRLGTLYERGRGVQGDAKKAAQWYLQAATHGNRKAMHNLAVAYAEGAGVTKNYAEAARWFTRAADLGLADSQFNLAVLYERGLGVPQSLVDAYKWYAIAAAQGDTESKNRVDAMGTQLTADERAAAQKAAAAFSPQPLNRPANLPPEMNSQG